MATKFQYLHINSEERAPSALSSDSSKGDDATLNISLAGHQIKDIKNVAVKQFSIQEL